MSKVRALLHGLSQETTHVVPILAFVVKKYIVVICQVSPMLQVVMLVGPKPMFWYVSPRTKEG